jgi:hypothetical protein
MSNNCNIKLWAIFIYLINSRDFIHTLTCCALHVTFCVNRDNIVDCIQCKVGATYFVLKADPLLSIIGRCGIIGDRLFPGVFMFNYGCLRTKCRTMSAYSSRATLSSVTAQYQLDLLLFMCGTPIQAFSILCPAKVWLSYYPCSCMLCGRKRFT